MTTREVLEALGALHPAQEWLSYRECWRIDLFAMRAWRSGIGHRRVAYEVKVSRADFRSEIARPEKRALALDLAHTLYFACPDGLIEAAEVPEECGLVWVSAERLRPTIVKRAPLREPRPFTDREIIYLARYPLYREGIEADRIELARLRLHLARLKRERYGSSLIENQEAPAT
jgi:hypothetical protein